MNEEDKHMCIEEISSFVQHELVGDVGRWCEDNVDVVADIYKKYIGSTHALVYASHLMYFIHTTLNPIEPCVVHRLLKVYIECQLVDFQYATDGY